MSGIAGIINLDQKPVDKQLLSDLTETMAFRGPDGKTVWTQRYVGFSHALLQTTIEAENDNQPCSLDGHTWIVADARVDNRTGLRAKLEAKGVMCSARSTDAELILQAYHAWGEYLVNHLLGDFAFAIWDRQHQKLFCARDHFGIKPFFYAKMPCCFIFSNTLECIRSHPLISNRLNEQVISEALLTGYNVYLDSSAFADIERLPPAHTLTITPQTPCATRRYWNLSVQATIRYKKPEDYTDHFIELLNTSVKDRLRTRQVGILMSGGLDSTSVAAIAAKQLNKQYADYKISASTFLYERYKTDEERYYAQLVAEKLGITIHYINLDDHPLRLSGPQKRLVAAEPWNAAFTATWTRQIEQIASDFPVILTGQGGDPALDPSPLYLKELIRGFLCQKMAIDTAKYILSHGRLPRLGVRKILKRRFNHNGCVQGFPPWLNQELAARNHLYERWERLTRQNKTFDSVRSQACMFLSSPIWTSVFESYDPGITRYLTELRHPFFDLRLLTFLLALPTVPWCIDKYLIRTSMHDILPQESIHRPKSPIGDIPEYRRLMHTSEFDIDCLVATPGFDRFVNVDVFLKLARNQHKLRPGEINLITRPIDLALWLQQIQN